MSVIGFEIRTAQLTPSTYVVSVTGEIDAFTSPALEQELEWVLGDGASSAVVDLAEVGFMDSTALRVLLKALPRFTKRGGKLVLVSDDRRVLRTLEITDEITDGLSRFCSGGIAFSSSFASHAFKCVGKKTRQRPRKQRR